jgi:hypothetical protein
MLPIIVLALLVILLFLYPRHLHPLAKFPGPFLASLTNLWKIYHIWKGDLEKVLLECHQTHGKIIRIGPNHLDVDDDAAVKTILGSGRRFQKR